MLSIIKRNGAGNQPATTFSGLVDDLFEKNLNHFFDSFSVGSNGVLSRNQVPVNIRETDKDYELHLVAPGLRKEDFKVDMNGDMLTISFEHKEEHNQKGNDWLRQEYSLQSFTRSFTLDDTVDAGKITANYNNGILRVLLPKKEGAQKLSRTIEIE